MGKRRPSFSVRRVLLALAGVLMIPLLLLAWYIADGARYHHARVGMYVIRRARDLAEGMESFKAENGRYPDTEEEYMGLGSGGLYTSSLVDAITSVPRRAGGPLTDVILPEGSGDNGRGPLLVISGRRARIEFYGGRRIGFSEWFVAHSEIPLRENEIVLSNDPWRARTE